MTPWLIIVAILLLIWIALLQPVWLRVAFGPEQVEVRLRYLGISLGPLGSDGGDRPSKPEKERMKAEKRSGSPRAWLNLIPQMKRAAVTAVRYLLRRILIRTLRLHATLGLSDPASTGLIYGICQALMQTLPLPKRADIWIVPDFVEETTAVEGEFEGGIRPSSVIASGFVLLWHLPKLRMIRAMRS